MERKKRTHRRDTEVAEFELFFNQGSFLCALSASAVIPN
jgi:hypothetical protein